MYRCGIIGCGFIGVKAPDNHAMAYTQCMDTDLITLCDTRLWDSPFSDNQYSDYHRMVKEANLDIVSVCTPPETHCQIVCGIAPYVKAIYCEKPIALTIEDADKMIETCHKHNVILQINHQRRFILPHLKFSRDLIDTGTHAFDLLRQIFGECSAHPIFGSSFWLFGSQWVEIEYINTNEHIFELDCTHNAERMILQGVHHLVGCLEHNRQSISSGEDGRQSLRLALKFKEMYEEKKNS